MGCSYGSGESPAFLELLIPDNQYDVIFDTYVEYHDMPVCEWLQKIWNMLKLGRKFYSVCIDEEYKSELSKWCYIMNPSYQVFKWT